jgi:gliding motility-associated-like protein
LTPEKVSITIVCLVLLVCPVLGQHSVAKKNNSAASVLCQHLPADFTVEFNVCDQYQVDFENNSLSASAVAWDFGDGSTGVGNDFVSHVYKAEGVYKVMLVVLNQNGCNDTIFKPFLLSIDKGNIFSSKNMSVCSGASFRMAGDPDAFKNCWSPAKFLNATDTYDPLCTPATDVAYQYNIIKKGGTVITNGNFSNGNNGFSTDYVFDSTINTSGHYFVGPKPKQWNPLYDNCFMDTTTFIGDTMLIVNGGTQKGMLVWDSTVTVAPNTNYILSFFAQSLTVTDSLVLNTSINGGEVIDRTHLSPTPCIRQRIMTTWYSDSNTTVSIKITDLDTNAVKNDFAIDSITFRPIYLKTDSIFVTIKPPPVFTVDPPSSIICSGDSVMLTAAGGDSYSWSPSATVAQPNAPGTLVSPVSNTNYKVVITESSCNISDSLFVNVLVKPKPVVNATKSNDLTCTIIQSSLSATGGISYHWWPDSTLSDANIPNPIAQPHDNTVYHVSVTGENACTAQDSVQVLILKDKDAQGYLLPSAFTPNNDGLNDCFGIRKWGSVTDLQFFVFNRWGNRLFSGTNASDCWDGMYKRMPQPTGTYIYYVRGNTLCGYVERKGTIVLLR